MQSVAAAAIPDEIRRKTLGLDGIKNERTAETMCNVVLLEVMILRFESGSPPKRSQLDHDGSFACRPP